jgi:hypothetical protein
MQVFGDMWTDQDLEQYAYDPEDDPVLAHFSIILYLLAAVTSTLLTIYIVLHSPMHS